MSQQNWRLIWDKLFCNLIWYYHTLYPDTSLILIIALLSFVDHDGIPNYGCHTKTSSQKYTTYKNNVLICISADDNYSLGGTRMHSKTLRCIPRHMATFQVTQLHSKELDCIPRNATWTWINIYLVKQQHLRMKSYNRIH
jgi:hypothetical protein